MLKDKARELVREGDVMDVEGNGVEVRWDEES